MMNCVNISDCDMYIVMVWQKQYRPRARRLWGFLWSQSRS